MHNYLWYRGSCFFIQLSFLMAMKVVCSQKESPDVRRNGTANQGIGLATYEHRERKEGDGFYER